MKGKCVGMCVCVSLSLCIRPCVCLCNVCVHMYAYTSLCMCLCVHTSICVYKYVCVPVQHQEILNEEACSHTQSDAEMNTASSSSPTVLCLDFEKRPLRLPSFCLSMCQRSVASFLRRRSLPPHLIAVGLTDKMILAFCLDMLSAHSLLPHFKGEKESVVSFPQTIFKSEAAEEFTIKAIRIQMA